MMTTKKITKKKSTKKTPVASPAKNKSAKDIKAGSRWSRLTEMPDASGHFGEFGGEYAPETLMPAVKELIAAWKKWLPNREFQAELKDSLANFAGRPTPLTHAKRLSAQLGGAQIWLKREDLLHTGAHKLNNTLGQILLARKMGKTRIIAETGAGQHGVATATVCARFGMPCEVYMGEEDTQRQSLNVFRMRLMGAKVHPVKSGTKTLKDAINEAIRDWIGNVRDTYYLLGSATGFHPYPAMVRDFQKIIGEEARAQVQKQAGKLPEAILACVNGGSNAIGLFYPFLTDDKVKIIGVEAAGDGVDTPRTAATMTLGSPGVLHGARTFVLQDREGQIMGTHSISAGLDYPGVGPEHANLKATGRATYAAITDAEAVAACERLSQTEGILPALESSHAVAQAMKLAPTMKKKDVIVICLSGRGDKDVVNIERAIKERSNK